MCGTSDLPAVSPGLTVRLQGLGGLPGENMLMDTSSLTYHYGRGVKPHRHSALLFRQGHYFHDTLMKMSWLLILLNFDMIQIANNFVNCQRIKKMK